MGLHTTWSGEVDPPRAQGYLPGKAHRSVSAETGGCWGKGGRALENSDSAVTSRAGCPLPSALHSCPGSAVPANYFLLLSWQGMALLYWKYSSAISLNSWKLPAGHFSHLRQVYAGCTFDQEKNAMLFSTCWGDGIQVVTVGGRGSVYWGQK